MSDRVGCSGLQSFPPRVKSTGVMEASPPPPGAGLLDNQSVDWTVHVFPRHTTRNVQAGRPRVCLWRSRSSIGGQRQPGSDNPCVTSCSTAVTSSETPLVPRSRDTAGTAGLEVTTNAIVDAASRPAADATADCRRYRCSKHVQ